jgi:hypothetical protein
LGGSIDVYAFYKLRFYELDQAIAVGDDREFCFFVDPHFAAAPGSPVCPGMVLVFANTVGHEGQVRHRCAIRSITHPVLGDVRSIDTDGLEYRVNLASGEVVVIDAEEDVGTIAEGGRADLDWSFLVEVDVAAQTDDAADEARPRS